MVLSRRIGGDGPAVSQICYGAMRLAAEVDGLTAADHLCRLHDAGITTIHSSHEYPTDQVLIDALASATGAGRSFEHIVKLAEPSFDERSFDAARLTRAVDRRLADLHTERLDCIQWMIRTPEPQDDAGTVGALEEGRDRINTCMAELVAAGKIGSMALFPYTRAIAEAAIDGGTAQNLAVYLNPEEDDYTDLADRCRSVIAIRPLAGGSLTAAGPDAVGDALRYPLLHPAVATTIVSINSTAHVSAAVTAAGGTVPDRDAFDEQRAARTTGDGV
ncbi:MAG: aldo/keto reductase [Actinomycetota bacterium]